MLLRGAASVERGFEGDDDGFGSAQSHPQRLDALCGLIGEAVLRDRRGGDGGPGIWKCGPRLEAVSFSSGACSLGHGSGESGPQRGLFRPGLIKCDGHDVVG